MTLAQAHALTAVCTVAEGNSPNSMREYSIEVNPLLSPDKPESYVRTYSVATTKNYNISLSLDNVNRKLSVRISDLQFTRSFSGQGLFPKVTALFHDVSNPSRNIWVQCEF